MTLISTDRRIRTGLRVLGSFWVFTDDYTVPSGSHPQLDRVKVKARHSYIVNYLNIDTNELKEPMSIGRFDSDSDAEACRDALAEFLVEPH